MTTHIAVSDKWEDLGDYIKTENVRATDQTAAEQKALKARNDEIKLEELRARLQSPGLPQPVIIQKPEKVKVTPAVQQQAAVQSDQPKPAKPVSLVSDHTEETLQTMRALKTAMQSVGLKQGVSGFSTFKE